jgi:Zn-dependent protease
VNIFRLLTIREIPVFVSPTYVLLVLSFGQRSEQPFVWALSITATLLVHELGHALMARRLLHKPSILLHGFGSVTSLSRVGPDVEEAVIIAMGPACSLALGLVVFATWLCVSNLGIGSAPLFVILYALMYASIGWTFVNLLPVWPFDGGHLLHVCAARRMSSALASRVTYIISLAIIVVLTVYAARHLLLYWSLLLLVLAGHNVYALCKGQEVAPHEPVAPNVERKRAMRCEDESQEPADLTGSRPNSIRWLIATLSFLALAVTFVFMSPLFEVLFY